MKNFSQKKISFLVFILFILFVRADNHKFYVSTSIAKLIQDKKTIQVISQIFIDDLENTLKLNYDKIIKLAPDSNSIIVDSLLSDYFQNNLKFIESGKVLNSFFVGKEYKKDVAICYTEFFFDSIPKSVQVRNTILFDFTLEQKNIFHFQNENLRKSFLFHPDENTFSIKLR